MIDGMNSVSSVLAVVAENADGEAIWFLPEAFASARDSPFSGDMLDVFRHLRAVCQVAERYHSTGDAVFSFATAFTNVGVPESQYKPFTDEQTYNMHAAEYTRNYDPGDGAGVRQIRLGPHLTLGIRTNLLVRTYWYVDATHRRLVVGHRGPASLGLEQIANAKKSK